jgi:hypothetical protein
VYVGAGVKERRVGGGAGGVGDEGLARAAAALYSRRRFWRCDWSSTARA